MEKSKSALSELCYKSVYRLGEGEWWKWFTSVQVARGQSSPSVRKNNYKVRNNSQLKRKARCVFKVDFADHLFDYCNNKLCL